MTHFRDNYYLVAFGMKGSFAGISHYEVHDGGTMIGEAFNRNGQWYSMPPVGNRRLGPFKTRKAAVEALIWETPKP